VPSLYFALLLTVNRKPKGAQAGAYKNVPLRNASLNPADQASARVQMKEEGYEAGPLVTDSSARTANQPTQLVRHQGDEE